MIHHFTLKFQQQNKLVKRVNLLFQFNQYKQHNMEHSKIIIEWCNFSKNVKKQCQIDKSNINIFLINYLTNQGIKN